MTILWWILGTAAVVIIALNLFATGEKNLQHAPEHLYPTSDPQFLRAMGSLLGPSLVEGNQVSPCYNGDQIFPAMLGAIRAAEKTITFETYIYWSGEIGREFAEALSERARAGVRVHVLLDWVGSGRLKRRFLEDMQAAGVEVCRYHPLHWYTLARINNRTHRKLLVVDGKVGFTGGVGIADKWLGNAQDPDHWRDSQFRVEGPVVAQFQAAFMDNWLKTQAKVLHGSDYFPALEPGGSHLAQVFQSSPREGSESVRLMYLLSIASAEKAIHLANSYFVPDDLAVESFVTARARGVSVQIIVPGEHIDAAVTRRASRSRWGPLLEAGVEIFEYQPTMFHCKVMVVDGLWVSVGSTNFDNRSFRLNDEANLNVFDEEFAATQIRTFEEDLRHSRRVSLEEWKKRPLREKALESAASLLRSQL
ncbi:MAG: phosphatidylserine/phosphatidylglycerophosphate/cardiolipin synthase family protein [Thermoanaerobaculia bacterium]